MIFSVILHIAILVCASLSFSGINRPNTLLMDIEIAGEGEFREAMENTPSSPVIEQETPLKPEEQPKVEEQSKPEEIQPQPEEPKEATPAERPSSGTGLKYKRASTAKVL